MSGPTFIAFGLNHESAPVQIRELLDLPEDVIGEVYRSVRLRREVEWILLSTCNRVEVWMYGSRSDARDIQDALRDFVGRWPSEHAFMRENKDALQHIMEVVSGVRSQITGDSQILSQVKTAYRLAADSGVMGPRMHRLMHVALATAKRVINTTALGAGAPSIAKTAVRTLSDRLESEKRVLGDMRVLVIGCGGMGATVLRELAGEPPRECHVVNRTAGRAEKVAGKYGFAALPWRDRHQFMASADIVVVTTSASDYVARASDLKSHEHRGRTLIVDISVPRNVDPSISDLPGYDVLNIDELSGSSESALAAMRRDLERTREICAEAVEDTIIWEGQWTAVEPAARVLHDTFESVRQQEVERNLHRFPERHHQQIELLTRSIMQKMMAVPIVRLKEMANGDADLNLRLELLTALFNRGDCEE